MANSTVAIGTGAGGLGTATLDLVIAMFRGTTGPLPDFLTPTTIEPPTLSNANSPLNMAQLNTLIGDNTINVPSLAGGVVLAMTPANVATVKLKGVSGDTGVLISAFAPSILCFDTTPPASFILNTSASISLILYWF